MNPARRMSVLAEALFLRFEAVTRHWCAVCLGISLTCFVPGGCTDQGEQPIVVDSAVIVRLIDVTVTEAYLHVTVERPAARDTVFVQRDGTTIMSFAAVAETTIVDTGLSQSTMHEYDALLRAGPVKAHKSPTISVRTLAPSSHAYSWQSYVLGDGGATSYLTDAAIVNDTLAYAVGAIYMNDSLGNWDPLLYNLARWNGRSWELMRIQFYTICGQSRTTPYPARSIVALSASDIWIAMYGDQVAHWNGATQPTTMCMPVSFSILRIWGESSNSVYAVGSGGNILHYSNGTWTRLESNTTTNINNAWGVIDAATGNEEVFCSVTDFWQPGGCAILRISDGTTVQRLPWDVNREVSSVWANSNAVQYACGDGLWRFRLGTWQQMLSGTAGYMNAVRGTGLNDIAVADVYGHIHHFDGETWQMFTPGTSLPEYGYVALAVRGNILIAVGEGAGKGVITIGRRTH